MKNRSLLLFAALALMVKSASAQPAPPAQTNGIVLPTGIKDPIEPFNRGVWSFNKAFLTCFVRPVSKVYRRIIIKPVRDGIARAGKNLTYPDRLANNLLQGNWVGSGEETERCLCNTVFGLGGFFDVATHIGMPSHDTGFGETFKKWGWQPDFYLMLPIYGPGDDRDAVGLVGDIAVLPQTYFFPYDLIGTGVTANGFTDTAEAAVCFSESQADPYSILGYAWSFTHESKKADMRVIGEQDQATLETLQDALFTYTNAEFPARSKTRSVLIPTTGRKLAYTYWLQPGRAPVVYIVPGFGAHRLSGNELALAELLYRNGFSAVCISSTFHPEFMENASSTELPSYPPADVHDVRVAIEAIDHRLSESYPNRLGARALMGYSMGAFQSLCIAGQEATNKTASVKFDRYVSIDSPVNLRYAVTNLDQYYQAPLAWPAETRTAKMENALLKVAALSALTPKAGDVLPFEATESKFLVGLGLRLTLRDIIFDSQLRHNRGILRQPLKWGNRRAAYDEIMQISFWDYITKFAVPYDKSIGIDMTDPGISRDATGLRVYADALKANSNVRIIANRNDFLLAPEDVEWIQATFDPSLVTLFPHGGHLGNLAEPDVQSVILRALDGLGAAAPLARR